MFATQAQYVLEHEMLPAFVAVEGLQGRMIVDEFPTR
jgi:hypothetical protein